MKELKMKLRREPTGKFYVRVLSIVHLQMPSHKGRTKVSLIEGDYSWLSFGCCCFNGQEWELRIVSEWTSRSAVIVASFPFFFFPLTFVTC